MRKGKQNISVQQQKTKLSAKLIAAPATVQSRTILKPGSQKTTA